MSTDGWCPFSFSSTGPVYCVVNGVNSAPAPGAVITSLQSLKLTGAVAGVRAPNDFIAVTTPGGVVNSASGNNYFPDLGQQWQEAEFNVFGDGGGDQAVFSAGTTVIVRTQVDNGSAIAPACDDQSFTGELSNLSLVGTPANEALSALPSIVFEESNARGTPPTCATPQGINCVEVSSSGSTSCTDAGGVPSTCATAICPAGFALTGGGGACAAGSSKIKSLFPLEFKGQLQIACWYNKASTSASGRNLLPLLSDPSTYPPVDMNMTKRSLQFSGGFRMIELLTRPIGRLRNACALALVGATLACVPSLALTLSCTQVTSSGSTSCTDAGGVPSTCASVACPAGFTLTGAGGACAAGGSRIEKPLSSLA